MKQTVQAAPIMGLQATSGKRALEGVDDETEHRFAKQPCLVRVGIENPENDVSAGYEPIEWANNKTTNCSGNYYQPADLTACAAQNSNYGATYKASYTTLTPVPPYTLDQGSSYERVCSSPRPYVQPTPRENFYANNNNARNYNGDYDHYRIGSHHHNARHHHHQRPNEPDNPCRYSSYSQNIRREENGKSYLELGSRTWRQTNTESNCAKTCSKCGWTSTYTKWDWSRSWPCYRHQRLSVLSLSMVKLNRYRQFPDPSLHRSVLICNTLRHIEDEMERDGVHVNLNDISSCHYPSQLTANPANYCHTESYQTYKDSWETQVSSYEHVSKNSSIASSGSSDEDSGLGAESKEINWSSVLSLSTSSDFDPVFSDYDTDTSFQSHTAAVTSDSNSFLHGDLAQELDMSFPSWKLTPISADEVIKSFPNDWSHSNFGRKEDDLDSLMHMLVGT